MKYSAFEQAAIEASAGLKEIDAEFEQLEAKKHSLEEKRELLETLVHQLLMVLPTRAQASSSDEADKAGADAPAARSSSFLNSIAEKPFAQRKEEWPAFVQHSTSNPLERR
jgi:hypothetical protein